MKNILFMMAAAILILHAGNCFAYGDSLGTDSDPLKHFRENSPNYNDNYYEDQLGGPYARSNRDEDDYEDNRPHGSDIRDYNPYYDRNGNLKKW